MSIKSRLSRLEDKRGDLIIVLPHISDEEYARQVTWTIDGRTVAQAFEQKCEEDRRTFGARVSSEMIEAVQASHIGQIIVLDPAYSGV